MTELLDIAEEVADALAEGRPLVALESSVIAQGLPWPDNLSTARAMEAIIRDSGALPATTAILRGRVKIGLSNDDLDLLARTSDVAKVGPRDIAWALATKRAGATTVGATLIAADLAGIPVMATGGIGGVHRGAYETFDQSADLTELARHPLVVVASGAKSILDVPKTLEVLETLGVPVIGFRTSEFPAFHARSSGLTLSLRLEEPEEVASVLRHQKVLGLIQALLVANPIRDHAAVPKADLECWIDRALEDCASANISGKAVTPYLLERLSDLSNGQTLTANKALLIDNARLASEIAIAYVKASLER